MPTLPKFITLPRPQEVSGLPQIKAPVTPGASSLPAFPDFNKPVYRPQAGTEKSIMFDYNDPDQINSFADVAGKHIDRILTHAREGEFVKMLADVVPVQMAKDTIELGVGTIRPLLELGIGAQNAWKATGLNLMNNAIETMDIAANPMKGLIMEGPQGAYDAAFNRVNFDFDTGHWSTDILAEVFVDPVNYISLGAKAVVSGATRAAAKATVAEVAQEGIERQLKQLVKNYSQNVTRKGAKDLASVVTRDSLLKGLSPEMTKQLEKTLMHRLNINLISSLNTIRKGVDKFDGFLIQSALLWSPKLIKKIGTPVLGYVSKTLESILQPAQRTINIPASTYNLVDKLPEVMLELDSLSAAHEAINTGELFINISNQVVMNDVFAIQKIIGDNYKNPAQLLADLEIFAKQTAPSWEEYAKSIKVLQEGAMVSGQLDILGSYVDDLSRIMKEAEETKTVFKSSLTEFSNELADEISKLVHILDPQHAHKGLDAVKFNKINKAKYEKYYYDTNRAAFDRTTSEAARAKSKFEWLDTQAKPEPFKLDTPKSVFDAKAEQLKLFDFYDGVDEALFNDVLVQFKYMYDRHETLREMLDAPGIKFQELLDELRIGLDEQDIPGILQAKTLRMFESVASIIEFGKNYELPIKAPELNTFKFSKLYEKHFNASTLSSLDDLLNKGVLKSKAVGEVAQASTRKTGLDFIDLLNNRYRVLIQGHYSPLLRNFEVAYDDFTEAFLEIFSGTPPTAKQMDDYFSALDDLKASLEIQIRDLDNKIKHTISKDLTFEGQYKEVSREFRKHNDPSVTIMPVNTGQPIIDGLRQERRDVYDLLGATDALYKQADESAEVMIDLDDELRRYTAKYTQLATNIQLFNSSELEELIDHVTTIDDVGILFNHLLASDMLDMAQKEEVAQSMLALAGIAKTRQLYGRVLASEVFDKNIQYALLDTLQSFATRPLAGPGGMLEKVEMYKYLINKGVNDNLSANTRLERFNLEAYGTKYWSEFDDWLAVNRLDILEKGVANHTAEYDVALTQFIAQDILKLDMSGTVVLDIETYGTNRSKGNQIIQLAYVLPDGTPITRNIKRAQAGIYPEPSVMRKLLGPEVSDGLSLGQLYEAFDAKYLEDAVDESTALSELLLYLYEFKIANGDVKIMGHNANNFDIPMIRNRLAQLEMSQFEKFEVVDTLEVAMKQAKVQALTLEQTDEINDIVEGYFTNRSEDLHYNIYKKLKADQVIDIGQEVNGTLIKGNTMYPLKFIENAGGDLASQLRMISTALQKGLQSTADAAMFTKYMDFAARVKRVSDGLYETLNHIGTFNRNQVGNYIDSTQMWRSVPSLLEASQGTIDYYMKLHNINITSVINKANVVDGQIIGIQSLGVRKSVDTTLIKDMFPGISGQHSEVLVEALTKTAGTLKRTINRLLHTDRLTDVAHAVHRETFEKLKTALRIFYGDEFFPKRLAIMNFAEQDYRLAFAQTYYLMNVYRGLIKDDTILKRLVPLTGDTADLYDIRGISEKIVNAPIYDEQESLEKFFEMNHFESLDGLPQDALDTATMDPYETLLAYEKTLTDSASIKTARAQVAVAMLRKSQQAFYNVVSMYNQITNLDELKEFVAKFKKYDDVISKHQLDQVLKMNPEQLKSYLWNDAKGVVIIPHTAGNEYILNQASLEAAGLGYYADRRSTFIFLPDEFDAYDLPKNYTLKDVDLVDDTYAEEYMAARKDLLLKDQAGTGTNLEELSRKTYLELRDLLPEKVASRLISVDTMDTYYRFLGMSYNHSVLGLNKERRFWLPHIYNNPHKNLYSSAQRLLNTADTQTKYTALIMDDSININSDMFKGFSDVEIKSYLKDNPHMQMAALVESKTQGYKLVIVTDMAEARRLNAVMLPGQYVSKAMQVINDNKLTDDTIKFFNKYVVGLTKTGQLSSLGFLMRNLFDSGLKNVMSAGSIKMLTHMMKTAGLYHDYTEILKMKQSYLVFDNDLFFQLFNTTKLDKATFNLFHDFITDGASAGLTKAVQDELSNVYKTLYRKTLLPDTVSVELIRKFIEEPSTHAIIEGSVSPQVFAELQRLAREKDIYSKAHAMLEHTTKTGLNIDTIATYLKRPELLPPELAKEFERISKFNPISKAQQWIDRKTFENPLSRSVMSANSYLEQVMRLSNFTYSIMEKGMSTTQAMYEVIRVHFDTANKTYKQIYAEMMFPFSTFMTRNIMYWLDEVSRHPSTFRYARDIMAPVMNLGDYSSWDLENRRGLQYHLLSGNILLNDETGMTLKLSPSMMDAYSFLYDPVNTLAGRLVPILKTPYEVMFVPKEDWMDAQFFETNKEQALAGLIPLIGPTLQRDLRSKTHVERTKSILPRAVSSVFGSVGLPKKFKAMPSNSYRPYNRTYFTNEAKPYAYYKARFATSTSMINMPTAYRKAAKLSKRDLFTAKGKSRLAQMMIPPSPGSSKYTIASIGRRFY